MLKWLKQILRLSNKLKKLQMLHLKLILNLNMSLKSVQKVVLSQVPTGVLLGVMIHAASEPPSPVSNLPIVVTINVVWELLNLTYAIAVSVSAAWVLLSPET